MGLRTRYRPIGRGMVGLLWLALLVPEVLAQSIQPAADGTGTRVQRQGNVYEITGGSRSGDRANLFHSFEQFGLTADEAATFRSQAEIRNILGRVVGGDPSRIDGLIRVLGGESNLFLMNPAGLVFGPNARLDVPGSFMATTATGIGVEGGWFEALGTPDYAALVGDPSRFAFALGEPGAIANFGNLRVLGGDLTLMGGTVINGGNLSAPNGDLVLAAVPGSRQVRLSQRGSLLSLDFDLLDVTQGAIAPTALPELLTGGTLTPANRIEVAADGTVRLAGGPAIEAGDVASIDSALRGTNTLLAATEDLAVQESRIRATGSLSLLAGDTVWLRDGAEPLWAIANQDLLIQGNQVVDIFALTQPTSGFQAGGDLRLRSATAVSGDAHFYSGGNLRVEQLDGSLGTLFSPYDPIIRSLGDVSFNNYTGASLHIIAAGQVIVPGTIIINGADPANGLRETVTLSSGASLRINGAVRPTLDIRAGVLPSAVGTPGILGTPPDGTAQNTPPTSANIRLGSVIADAPNLLVYLSTQYQPNPNLPGGSIRITEPSGISTDAFTGVVGDIVLDARQSVIVDGLLDAASINRQSGTIRVFAEQDIGVDGAVQTFGATSGAIRLISRNGSLNLQDDVTTVASGGNADRITLEATNGAIFVGGNVLANSTGGSGGDVRLIGQDAVRLGNVDTSGAGTSAILSEAGEILLTSLAGSLQVGQLRAVGTGGSGERVTVRAEGDVQTGGIDTRSPQQIGGAVVLNSRTGELRVQGDVDTQGADAGGSVRLQGDRNVLLDSIFTSGLNLGSTSGRIQINSSNGSVVMRRGSLNTGNRNGIGGAIAIAASGSIEGIILDNGSLEARLIQLNSGDDVVISDRVTTVLPAGSNSPGGNVLIEAADDLFVRQVQTGQTSAQQGGNIVLRSGGNLVSDRLQASSRRNPGSIRLEAGENLLVNDILNRATEGRGEDIIAIANNRLVLGQINADGVQSGGSIFLSGNSVQTGDLSVFSQSGTGGSISLQSSETLTTGRIRAASGTGNGGTVGMDANRDVEVAQIDVRGGASGNRGQVLVRSDRFIRITDVDSTGASINASGGEVGNARITLLHGGSNFDEPFVVGDAATNGSAGALVTRDTRISPTQSFPGSYVQENIAILTRDRLTLLRPDSSLSDPTPDEDPLDSDQQTIVPPPDDRRPSAGARAVAQTVVLDMVSPDGLSDVAFQALESNFANQFESYLSITATLQPTVSSAQAALADASVATGLQPAVVYARFAPMSAQETDPDAAELELVLITSQGDPIRKRVVGATRSRVLQIANQFRVEVTDPRRTRSTRYLPFAQQLHRWLIAPLEDTLEAEGIDNLAFVLDEGLRSLPIAALHDGDRFLIERYSVGLMPSLSLVDTRYRDIRDSQVLAMGASEFTQLSPLPAVPLELEEIATDLWDGTYWLNQGFTPENLLEQRRQTPYGIIHLATHGEFLPGDLSNSYIQFWDRRLQLDQIRQLGLGDPPVNLLVLSACRMALGDAQAELGFAGLALQSGAQSVLASLWYVSDFGSLALTTEFYRQLAETPVKASALRQAQLSMLQGDVRLSEGTLQVRGENALTLPDEFSKGNEPNLSHPFYWSAFTLVGSPW